MTTLRVLHLIDTHSWQYRATVLGTRQGTHRVRSRECSVLCSGWNTGPRVCGNRRNVQRVGFRGLRSPRARLDVLRLTRAMVRWAVRCAADIWYSNFPGLLAGTLARANVRIAKRRELARYLTRAQRAWPRRQQQNGKSNAVTGSTSRVASASRTSRPPLAASSSGKRTITTSALR